MKLMFLIGAFLLVSVTIVLAIVLLHNMPLYVAILLLVMETAAAFGLCRHIVQITKQP